MAKPTDNKDKDAPKKMPLELSPNVLMLLNNAIIILVIIVSMIIMYVVLDNSFNKKLERLIPQDEAGNSDEEEEVKQEGVLLDLGDFILNLSDTGSRRYLKVGVAMELSKTEAELMGNVPTKPAGHGEAASDPASLIVAEMERYKPAIRDAVISILSNKTSNELATPVGKEIATEEITEAVNAIFEGQREVMRVSFGQFIIQ